LRAEEQIAVHDEPTKTLESIADSGVATQSRFTRVTFHVPPVTLRPGCDGTVLNVPSIVRASLNIP
jgi:hypothetical protein